MTKNSFIDVLESHVDRISGRQAYIFLEDGEAIAETISYAYLAHRARAVTAQLQQYCRPGDRVLLLYPSCIDYMVAFFACLYAGVIAVPVFPPRGSKHNKRLEAILIDCGATTALTTTKQLGDMRLAIDVSPALSRLNMLCSDQVHASHANELLSVPIQRDTIAFLQYTSGSTGQPKGVVVTHGNLLQNEFMIQSAVETTEETAIVTWLPIYHDMGLIGNMLHSIWLGATCVFMPPLSFLQQPIRWLSAISRFRAYLSGGPNFGYDLCVNKINDEQIASLDLSSWRVAFNGAEPIRHGTLERFAERFAVAGFQRNALYPCYGMAETTLMVTGGSPHAEALFQYVDKSALGNGAAIITRRDNVNAQAIVGCGRALPEQVLSVVDPATLQQCADKEIGEIWVSGAHVGQGYWQKPHINREIFEARIDGSGEGPFLRTGDLGYLSDGELYVTGRLKDLIIVRGVNHYPHDIEATVEDADEAINRNGTAALGLQDENGERVVVIAEVGRSFLRSVDVNALTRKIREAVFERHELLLADVVFIRPSSLPKTSSGKVQRNYCRELYLAKEFARVEPVKQLQEVES
ncbi:MAG: fatty acyl-AMP ligase [Pseudomonadota bacterium]